MVLQGDAALCIACIIEAFLCTVFYLLALCVQELSKQRVQSQILIRELSAYCHAEEGSSFSHSYCCTQIRLPRIRGMLVDRSFT